MRTWLLKRVQLHVQAATTCTFTLRTNLPGGAVVDRVVRDFAATTGREVVDLYLPGDTRAQLVQYSLVSAGLVRLFGGQVWARALDGGDWGWLPLPGLPGQLVEWADIPLPMPAAPKAWADVPLPIPEAPKAWADLALPLPRQPDSFADIPLSIPQASKLFVDLALPIPEAPKSWGDTALPIPAPPKSWSNAKIPMRETPDLAAWVGVPVDE